MSLPLGEKTGLTDIHSNFFCAYLIYHVFLMHCLNDIAFIALVSICFIPKTSVKMEIFAPLYLVHDCNVLCLNRELPIFLPKNSRRDATVTKCHNVRNNVYFWHQIQTGGVDTADKISKYKCFKLFSSNVATIVCLYRKHLCSKHKMAINLKVYGMSYVTRQAKSGKSTRL